MVRIMFDCRACCAKDSEITRLVALLAEKDDRLMTMIGAAFQTQFHPSSEPAISEADEPAPEPTDDEWAQAELRRAERMVQARFGRGVLPDLGEGA